MAKKNPADTVKRPVLGCRYTPGTPSPYPDAAVFVAQVPNQPKRVQILAWGGRNGYVLSWERIENLIDFCCYSLPPDHPLYDDPRLPRYEDSSDGRSIVFDQIDELREAEQERLQSKDPGHSGE